MTTDISALAAASTPLAAAPASASTAPGTLSSDAILELIVAQLQYQDPTAPTDTSAFMTQTATLNQIESTNR